MDGRNNPCSRAGRARVLDRAHQADLLAEPRLDDDRGSDRHRRRDHVELDRPDRLWRGQHDHGCCERDHHLALHGQPGQELGGVAEKQAQKVVAITFFLLAPYIMVAAVHHLITGSEAQASWLGIGLAVTSVILMPSSAAPRSALVTASARAQRQERGRRTFSVRTSRSRSSSDSSRTPSLACGGPTRSWR